MLRRAAARFEPVELARGLQAWADDPPSDERIAIGNPPSLCRTDSAEVADIRVHALLYDGKRCVHHADDAMARITAERLIQV